MLLDQLADIRTALFDFVVPDELAQTFLHDRLFNFKPPKFTVPVAPTRDFWMHVLATKIEATIGNPGDMIGWEDDEETVGLVASSAKQSLLRVLPLILPPEDAGGGCIDMFWSMVITGSITSRSARRQMARLSSRRSLTGRLHA